jgi:hypothetical protein
MGSRALGNPGVKGGKITIPAEVSLSRHACPLPGRFTTEVHRLLRSFRSPRGGRSAAAGSGSAADAGRRRRQTSVRPLRRSIAVSRKGAAQRVQAASAPALGVVPCKVLEPRHFAALWPLARRPLHAIESSHRPARRGGSSLTSPDILSSNTRSAWALSTDEGSLARRCSPRRCAGESIKHLGCRARQWRSGYLSCMTFCA